MQRRTFLALPRVGLATIAVLAIIAAGVLATGTSTTNSRAQSANCDNAAVVGLANGDGSIAGVDVGEGNTVSFICVDSASFTGGQSDPITADAVVGDGCYTIEGINTRLVIVTVASADAVPGCDPLISIHAAVDADSGDATATPTATGTSTPTATATATSGTATATATSSPTSTPTTIAATATAPATNTATTVPTLAATATPIRPTVLPPNTGSGAGGSDGTSLPLLAGLAVLALVAGGAALVVTRNRA